MADHIFVQARDAIIARLVAGVSGVSGRVYKRDTEVVDAGRCPFLMVEILDADAPEDGGSLNASFTSAPSILQDEAVRFLVRCVVQQVQDGDAEKAAFALAVAAETALLGTNDGKTLGGIAVNVRRPRVSVDQDTRGALETYEVILQFDVWLRHIEARPDSFNY